MFQTKVTRHSFFRGREQWERFTEHAPLCVEESPHDLCNCTKTVVDRPTGEPESATQIVEFSETHGKYQMRLEMSAHYQGLQRILASDTEDDCVVKFCIKWPMAAGKVNRWGETEEHAYFWFLRENYLKVEVAGTGDGGVDCTLGNVYFGPDVDVSKFFNGFSPSRVVKPAKFASDDVWLHSCAFGGEAVATLSDETERGRLNLLRILARRIRKDVAPRNVVDVGVQEVRELVEVDSPGAVLGPRGWPRLVGQLVADAFDTIEQVIVHFQESALRKIANQVWEEAVEERRSTTP